MTQEDKELLIKDLCCRLPYKIKVEYDEEVCTLESIEYFDFGCYVDNYEEKMWYCNVEDIKPYLFPLSSMTEEQRIELNSLLPIGVSLQINSNNFTFFEIDTDLICCFHIELWDKFFDWLNKNHFDFRGLIEKSLALDATNLNIY